MGPLPFWQLFSLLGLSCVYQLISDCLSQHINSLSPSLLPSPPAHFPSSFFLGARGRLWDGFCWFASGFELVPVYGCLFAVCILYLSLFLLPFLYTFRGVCFWFQTLVDLWSWGGWSHISWPAFWLHLCLISLLWVFLSLLSIVHVQLYLRMLPLCPFWFASRFDEVAIVCVCFLTHAWILVCAVMCFPLLLRIFIKHSHVWISELGVSCLRFAFLEVDFWNVSCSVCLRLSHQLG